MSGADARAGGRGGERGEAVSEAIRRLHAFLAKSPSVVYPEDVLAYLPAIEAENDKMCELCGELLDNLMPEICARAYWCRDKDWRTCDDDACGNYTFVILARELGVEL